MCCFWPYLQAVMSLRAESKMELSYALMALRIDIGGLPMPFQPTIEPFHDR